MTTASEILKTRFRFSQPELDRFLGTCPYRYKEYLIRKKGGKGFRNIAHPSKVLKAVQRTLLDELLNEKLKVHDAAMAYKKMSGIKKNASAHLGSKYLLKMDFQNFFPSITARDFGKLMREEYDHTDEYELRVLSRVFFMKRKNAPLALSIGSPGSPVISNSIMYRFDQQISEVCRSSGIVYTRYSDDLTFSTSNAGVLAKCSGVVREIIASLPYVNLTINDDKTVHTSKKHNRHVTGITLTNDDKLSLGRQKKRELRAKVHQVQKLSKEERAKLSGHLAFLAHVEPEAYLRLKEKYEDEFRLIGSDIRL